MGCQSSTGANAKRKSIRYIRLTKVGVYSVDRFIEQMEVVMEKFALLIEDVER